MALLKLQLTSETGEKGSLCTEWKPVPIPSVQRNESQSPQAPHLLKWLLGSHTVCKLQHDGFPPASPLAHYLGVARCYFQIQAKLHCPQLHGIGLWHGRH